MSKDDLICLLKEKFPTVHGIAVIEYSDNGTTKHRYVNYITEPIENGALISAGGDLRRILQRVAHGAEFIGYAVQ